MRIIAGEWRGCRLVAPAGDVARPTTDRVKESMFNLMGQRWQGGVAVDLFAGSGALALEAVSRGAARAICVDTSARSIAAIRENIARCRAGGRVEVWRMDWRRAWQRVAQELGRVGWVFVDPPYALNLWPAVLGAIAHSAVEIEHGIVCEHPRQQPLPAAVGALVCVKEKVYGDIGVRIYQMQPEASAPREHPVSGEGRAEDESGHLPGQL